VVAAPAPLGLASTACPLNRVLSVVLAPEEDVRWIWTSTPEGVSYVSGYAIVQAQPKKSRQSLMGN